jgi:hypothetical protein
MAASRNGRFVLVQVHGAGICQCRPRCYWCERGFLCVDEEGRFFWDRTYKVRTNRAVVATRHGRLAGVLRYNIQEGLLTSWGTYVTSGLRQSGLGTYLWRVALRFDRPDRAVVRVVSDRGKTLAGRLKRRFRRVRWNVREVGKRKLRRLK